MLKLAQQYARLIKTKVIEGAFKENEDGSITFVLESGPKLTMTEKELKSAIAKLEAEHKAAFGNVVHTNEEAQGPVKTLAPKSKKGE